MLLHADSEDWSDFLEDAQADLSVRWTHRSFCCAAAHLSLRLCLRMFA